MTALPGPSLSINDAFGEAASRFSDRQALRHEGGTTSYAELDRRVTQAAHALRRLGVRRASTVAASMANGEQVVVAFLATMRLGARWVGVNRVLSPPEKALILRHSGARLLLVEEPDVRQWPQPGAGGPRRVVTTGGPSASWPRLLEQSPCSRIDPRIDPLAPAGLSYTSGTTGRPKGVVHSQHNLALPACYLATTPDFDLSSRPGVCLPLTILNVIVSAALPGLFSGAGCVILPKPEARTVAEAVARERVTTITMPPPVLYDLSTRADIEPGAMASVDRPRTGGAELPEVLRERYAARFGQDIAATYGLTEAPSVVAQETRSKPHVAGSSGEVVPYLEVSTLGPEGQQLAPGDEGELCLGPRHEGPWGDLYRPFLGYWRRPAASRDALAGHLVRTGDVGRVDAEGNLYVTDRKSNLILRGGANVYPAEVERTVKAMPGVTDCVVVGLPDIRLGERVAAAVEVEGEGALTAEQVAEHCRRRLARYKVPERIVLVRELPRNAMAKAVRREVKELLAEEATIGPETRNAGAARYG